MKKLVTGILCLVMLLQVSFSASAFYANNDDDYAEASTNCFTFENYGSDVKITGLSNEYYLYSSEVLKIPSKYNGKRVTCIGKSAFEFLNVKEIIIPDTVSVIDDFAFAGCKASYIAMPKTVGTIGKQAFSACSNLKFIKMPKEVGTIEIWAFNNCEQIKSIVLPKINVRLYYGAFQNCGIEDVYYSGKTAPNVYYDGLSAVLNDSLQSANWHYNHITPDSFSFSEITIYKGEEKVITPVVSPSNACKDYMNFKDLYDEPFISSVNMRGLTVEESDGVIVNKTTVTSSTIREYLLDVISVDGIKTQCKINIIERPASSECSVTKLLSPSNGTIDQESRVISDLRVPNKNDSVKIDVEVSDYATWDLYYTETSTTTYENKVLPLNEGRTKTAYIKVVAEDGTQKTYSISVYRQTKSEMPIITVADKYATITAPQNSNIIYTTDGSEPSEQNGISYTGKFVVTSECVIRAISKESDKDEYSDIAVYQVPKWLNISIIPIDNVYISNNKVYYNFFVEANDKISGTFFIGIYDKQDRLSKTVFADKLENEKEKSISNSFDIDSSAYSYKVFLWENTNNIKPLTNALSGVIEK